MYTKGTCTTGKKTPWRLHRRGQIELCGKTWRNTGAQSLSEKVGGERLMQGAVRPTSTNVYIII